MNRANQNRSRKGNRLGLSARGAWAAVAGAIFWVSATGQGAAPANRITPYSARTWQTDEGLPQNSVYAIEQTLDGYLWVGTHEGLTRFDGVRFTGLSEDVPGDLKHGWITALCASRDGSLWIGCDGYGLARFARGKFTHFSETDGLVSNQIRCLLEGKDGSIWIGSEGGLTRYKDGRFTNFTERNGLASSSVRGLCEDGQGNLRIATQRGLSMLGKDGVISTFNVSLGTAANALKAVCQDKRGRLWTVSNEGLYCVEGEKITTYGPDDGLPGKIGTAVYEDRAGQIWAGTYRGLARLVDGKVMPRPNSAEVFGDWIYTMKEDREGNLWVGGQDGLYRLNPARFATYTTREGLTHDSVMSVLEDRAGSIWVGTWGGGLNQMRDGQVVAHGPGTGLSHDKILGLHESPDGSLWVGTDHGGGLNRLKDGPGNLFTPSRRPGLIDAAIRVIHEDRKGALWIGTSRGLNIFKDGEFKTYTTANGLAGNTNLAICEAADGSVWVGTDAGLSHWVGGRFTNYTVREGLSANYINALYEDPAKTLWIGTRGGGLMRYKEGKFTTYTTREGLFSDEVYEIVEDDFDYFWMSCRKGIFRVSKKELEDFAQGKAKTISSTAYGKADGLVSVQCNGVAKPSGWKGKDGRIWFATIRGVVAVEPRLKTDAEPPPVVIEEVLADHDPLIPAGESASSGMQLKVPPGRGGLEIHYTALSYQAPEKNRFRYQLEGVDSGWVEAGTVRSAFYNNIAPGSYQFRVTACNDDGVWNEKGATLAIEFLPHYWQTGWFKLAVITGVVLLLTLGYRTRMNRLRGIERLRIQIAANLHDDVGARLTKVAMVTEYVDRETPEGQPIKAHIQNIFRTTREITQAMDEIVWTINPKNDTLENLANYIFQYAQEYFQNTGVRCRVDMPAQLPNWPMSTEARHNLFMAVKEAMNNVLKHAEATEVQIGLVVEDGQVTIVIADNGRGFRPSQREGRGNGLENMKQRLAHIGGRLVLDSEPGKGTQIRMETAAR